MAGGAVVVLFMGLRPFLDPQVFKHDAVVLAAIRRPFAARAPPR
jgi:hypothetical protein